MIKNSQEGRSCLAAATTSGPIQPLSGRSAHGRHNERGQSWRLAHAAYRLRVRLLLFIGFCAAFAWLALTLAHEAAGIDLMPGGGFFQFPEIRWTNADNLP